MLSKPIDKPLITRGLLSLLSRPQPSDQRRGRDHGVNHPGYQPPWTCDFIKITEMECIEVEHAHMNIYHAQMQLFIRHSGIQRTFIHVFIQHVHNIH